LNLNERFYKLLFTDVGIINFDFKFHNYVCSKNTKRFATNFNYVISV